MTHSQAPAPAPTPTPAPVCRVLQFTDSHLLADRNKVFLGIRPWETLDAVIELAFAQHPDPDLILLTGDLAQDGAVDTYRLIEQRFSGLRARIGLLPGNHDRLERMLQTFKEPQMQVGGRLISNAWQMLLLDSTVRGKVGGSLDRSDLDELERLLSDSHERHTLVCLHHQPVPIGTGWLDTIGLEQPREFLEVLDRHPQVKGVLWGHIHQQFDGHRHGIPLMASPSTSIQFKPLTEDFALDPVAPGYRWLELQADGRIRSGVPRLATVPEGLDLNTRGY